MEALGLGDSANLLPPEQLSRGLIQAFANFVQSRCIHPLKAQPKHTPQLYLQIWSCIQDMGEAGFLEGSVDQLEFADPMHPGLVNAVPRKRRSGAAHCQVRPTASRAALSRGGARVATCDVHTATCALGARRHAPCGQQRVLVQVSRSARRWMGARWRAA